MPQRTSALLLVDLMRLVQTEAVDSDTIIKAAFEWEHSRRLEVAKWLLATGAAALVAILTLLGRDEPPKMFILIVIASLGGLFATGGFIALWRASRVRSRFVQTSILCARLKEVRPFLTRLRQEGEL